MNKMKALRAMVEGKKVRVKNWTPIESYLMIKDYTILNQDGDDYSETFNSWDFTTEDVWEEYVNCNWKIGDKFHYQDSNVICEVLYVDDEIMFYKFTNNSKTEWNFVKKLQYNYLVRV